MRHQNDIRSCKYLLKVLAHYLEFEEESEII